MKSYGHQVAESFAISLPLLHTTRIWMKEKQFTNQELAVRLGGPTLFGVFNRFNDTDIDAAIEEAVKAKSEIAFLESSTFKSAEEEIAKTKKVEFYPGKTATEAKALAEKYAPEAVQKAADAAALQAEVDKLLAAAKALPAAPDELPAPGETDEEAAERVTRFNHDLHATKNETQPAAPPATTKGNEPPDSSGKPN